MGRGEAKEGERQGQPPVLGMLSLGLPPVLGISSSSWLARWEVTSREPGQELCCGLAWLSVLGPPTLSPAPALKCHPASLRSVLCNEL